MFKSLRLLFFSLVLSVPAYAQNSTTRRNSNDIRFQQQQRGQRRPPLRGSIPQRPDVKNYTRGQQTQDIARTRKGRIRPNMDQLFRIGWESLGTGDSERALGAFVELMKKRKVMTNRQRSDTYLGYGISLYHERGCGNARRPLELAMGFPQNRDDATYYLAMCDFQDGDFDAAFERFKEMHDIQHPKYADPARLHMAMIQEDRRDFDEAQTIYMDLVDFAEDQGLVRIAKLRLALLKQKVARDRRKKPRYTALFSLGGGYDTNATALPQGLDPASQNLDSVASATSLGLLYFDYKIPYRYNFDQIFNYSLLLYHYLDSDIAADNDLHSHDVGTTIGFDWNIRNTLELALGYNYLFLGKISDLNAYAASVSGDLSWTRSLLRSNRSTHSELEHVFSLARTESIRGAAPSQDPEAINYAWQSTWTLLGIPGHSYGPVLNLEYNSALGTESAYYRYGLDFFWEFTIAPSSLRLKWNNTAGFANSVYFDSSSGRKDWTLEFASTLSRMWGRHIETRLQVTELLNVSNVDDAFQYDKFQASFVLTAIF